MRIILHKPGDSASMVDLWYINPFRLQGRIRIDGVAQWLEYTFVCLTTTKATPFKGDATAVKTRWRVSEPPYGALFCHLIFCSSQRESQVRRGGCAFVTRVSSGGFVDFFVYFDPFFKAR